MSPFARVTKGIESPQQIKHLYVVAAATNISLFALNDKKRAEIDKRSLLDGTVRMSFHESGKELHLQHDNNTSTS